MINLGGEQEEMVQVHRYLDYKESSKTGVSPMQSHHCPGSEGPNIT